MQSELEMDTDVITINKNKSKEEIERGLKKFENMIMTKEEEKQLDEDIRNGIILGYIKSDGTPEMLR